MKVQLEIETAEEAFRTLLAIQNWLVKVHPGSCNNTCRCVHCLALNDVKIARAGLYEVMRSKGEV